MRRLSIDVSFDPVHGYVASHPGLPPLAAVSLGGLRKQVAALMLPDKVEVVLSLDKHAKRERDRRRSGGEARPTDYARAR